MDKPRWLDYKVGGVSSKGIKISGIVGCNYKCIVFISDKGGLQWEFDENIDYSAETSEASTLLNQIFTVLKVKDRERAVSLTGQSLFKSISKSPSTNITKEFMSAQEYISERMLESRQIGYLLSTLSGLAFILALGFLTACLTSEIYSKIVWGGMFGAVGAFVSILQRFQNLNISRYSSNLYIYVRGLSRLVLGIIFGGFVVLAHSSELALSIIKNNISAVLVFSFIAGISERFVPELIDVIANKSKNDDN